MTELIKTSSEIKNILSMGKGKKPIGLVPTMGALHAGHVSLIKTARQECKTVVVYIFVNPLQFGPNEDFNKYPRDLDSDLKVCQENNVDFIFTPDESEIYPDENSKKDIIHPPKELTTILCGKSRVGHFEGVATVVYKFFKIIEPDYAYFGEKDLQQIYVIRWLVNEFKLPIEVKSCPIIREANSLACSTRNLYLSKKEKEIASNIYKSLKLAKENTRTGFFTISKSILESLIFLSQSPEIKIEYFEARDKNDLKKVDENQTHGFYYLTATKVGNVRLIDNIEVV